jgi:hypothetical protein
MRNPFFNQVRSEERQYEYCQQDSVQDILPTVSWTQCDVYVDSNRQRTH